MKTSYSKLLHCRLAQTGALLVLLAAVAASIAWSGLPEGRIKLEGAWIATADNGVRALVTYAPSDPSGQSATFRAQFVWPAEQLATMGLDAVTDEVAEDSVTGNETSRYHGFGTGLAGGRTMLIFVDDCVLTFESPTQKRLAHALAIYLASSDADNDGYPDPGSTPVMSGTSTSISKRIAR